MRQAKRRSAAASCQRADKAGLAAPGTGHAGPVDRDYDLIVIGGGAAGLAAAQAGAAARARTLVVAEGEIGGECTFTGCVPSKTLIEAAARRASFAEAAAAVRKAVGAIADNKTPAVLRRSGIEVLRGRAAFTSPREITVGGPGCGPAASSWLPGPGPPSRPCPAWPASRT
jgi:hypothetical protein